MTSTKKDFKLWSVTSDGPAFMVTPSVAIMKGTQDNFIATSDTGITLMGKSITLGTSSENIRQGGMFVQMNDFIKMMPSSVVTPQPQQIPFPPVGFASKIVRDLPFFLGLLIVGGVAAGTAAAIK